MAKLKVLGDMIQIKIELTESDFNKVKNYAPDALKIKNDDGDEVFGISMGDAHWSKYGVAFCNTDSDGKLFMTTNNPVVEHGDPAEELKIIKEKFAQTIFFLEMIEKNFDSIKTELNAMEQNAERSIEMA
jgi:hypothetical protein